MFFFINLNLPDIGHFTFYNSVENIFGIQISKCAPLMAFSKMNSVNLTNLDGYYGFPNNQHIINIFNHSIKILLFDISKNSKLIAS
jgi:hypothetical protein